MKHATKTTLSTLQPLLLKLRALDGLRERRPGVFYRAGAAFLHFHEDPAGIFADLKIGDDWERMPVNTAAERNALLRRARAVLKGATPGV